MLNWMAFWTQAVGTSSFLAVWKNNNIKRWAVDCSHVAIKAPRKAEFVYMKHKNVITLPLIFIFNTTCSPFKYQPGPFVWHFHHLLFMSVLSVGYLFIYWMSLWWTSDLSRVYPTCLLSPDDHWDQLQPWVKRGTETERRKKEFACMHCIPLTLKVPHSFRSHL